MKVGILLLDHHRQSLPVDVADHHRFLRHHLLLLLQKNL
jgi:hypothetical protein